ncbi:MAG: hypothetical protein ACYSTO_12360 [Planctomycetota bacterium]
MPQAKAGKPTDTSCANYPDAVFEQGPAFLYLRKSLNAGLKNGWSC